MEKIAIIGAGVSGLSCAHFLKDRYDVTVFEKEERPGGLIKCRRVDGSLFHTCGGHVFNSKRQDVLDWFWSIFQREEEFSKTDRNSCVFMDKDEDSNSDSNTNLEVNSDSNSNGLGLGLSLSSAYTPIPYPIENHMYLFNEEIQKCFYEDLDEIDKVKGLNAKFTDYDNFGDFLRWRFGKTLYNMYFQPYNEKVWRRDLTSVPMSWMEGKLPMPTTQEMRDNNANHVEEKAFVHSTFWYEKNNGSQYIADKLSEGLDIRYNADVQRITFKDSNANSDSNFSNSDSNCGKWVVCGEEFDKVIFCGNIKDMAKMIEGVDISEYKDQIEALEYHGTTAVFCEIDKNPYSWIYQPSRKHESHRIICTGNFSPTNNDVTIAEGRITATIEFTDEIIKEDILDNLKRIPLNPKYIDHKFNKYTYPIQDANTRDMIKILKADLAKSEFYFTGRFADWEYYNMDVAMGAAMDLCKKL